MTLLHHECEGCTYIQITWKMESMRHIICFLFLCQKILKVVAPVHDTSYFKNSNFDFQTKNNLTKVLSCTVKFVKVFMSNNDCVEVIKAHPTIC